MQIVRNIRDKTLHSSILKSWIFSNPKFISKCTSKCLPSFTSIHRYSSCHSPHNIKSLLRGERKLMVLPNIKYFLSTPLNRRVFNFWVQFILSQINTTILLVNKFFLYQLKIIKLFLVLNFFFKLYIENLIFQKVILLSFALCILICVFKLLFILFLFQSLLLFKFFNHIRIKYLFQFFWSEQFWFLTCAHLSKNQSQHLNQYYNISLKEILKFLLAQYTNFLRNAV